MLICHKIVYTLAFALLMAVTAYAQQQPTSPEDVKPAVVTLSSASYATGAQARGSIVASFGDYIHPEKITIKASDGNQYTVTTIFAATDRQVNYLIPDNVPVGPATFTFTTWRTNDVIQTDVTISDTVPGIYAANANGGGLPAGVVLRVKTDGTQVYEPVVMYDPSVNQLVARSIHKGPEGERVFLVLFGTGVRHGKDVAAWINGRKTTAQYSGPQGYFNGLDQINIELPRDVFGYIVIPVIVDDKDANWVYILWE
jgi:uncharacterized protein (TIGR03437 family)